MESVPDSVLDMLYLDGLTSYEEVFALLALGFRKVRNGGWVSGRGFGTNPVKTDKTFRTKVRSAVKHFCRIMGLRLFALALDGQLSFAVRILKPLENQFEGH